MATEARYAFATSEDAATVTAIDLATRQAVATLPAGPVAHALTLTLDGGRLYVVNRRGGSLTVVDARALAVLDTIALPTDPMAAAISPDGRWLAVLGRGQRGDRWGGHRRWGGGLAGPRPAVLDPGHEQGAGQGPAERGRAHQEPRERASHAGLSPSAMARSSPRVSVVLRSVRVTPRSTHSSSPRS